MVEKTLSDLFLAQLKDIYYAEKKIFRTLPKMVNEPVGDSEFSAGIVPQPSPQFAPDLNTAISWSRPPALE